MELNEIIDELNLIADKKNTEGMAKFGINTNNALGISMPKLRAFAKRIGSNHKLALALWETKIHEAMILAPLIDVPGEVTKKQMDKWVKDFDSWDVCDQCCMNLFDKTEFAYEKAVAWSAKKDEFVKRAGFTLMAVMAVHNKKESDEFFESFYPIIRREANDERNFVKKAVNWAIRQIGKRNADLRESAIKLAEEIEQADSKAAKWIAKDALRELRSRRV
jgi:3-methyladenine DNA glycosylase AlkD